MMQDLRFAVRMARKEPGTTLAVFLALALGIGGATAIFSVVNAAMLRPLPVKDGRALVRVYASDSSSNEDDVSMADYLDWKRDIKSFSSSAAFATSQVTLSGFAAPERAVCIYTESTLLPTLGVTPKIGRNFERIENEAGHTDEAILSWRFWQSHFGGAAVLGKRIMLDEQPYTIVGVLPENFTFLGKRDLLLPLTLDTKSLQNRRGYHQYQVIARLAHGVTLEQANAELSTYTARAARLYPVENRGVSARAISLSESLTGEGLGSAQKHVRTALLVLLAAILCVLAIACGNVANINLIRAVARAREIAIRVAVGASRFQLFRQVLIESLLLAVTASVAGLLFAGVFIRILIRLPLNAIPRIDEAAIDWRVFLFALSVGCATGIAFGLAPAIRSGGVHMPRVLRQTGGRAAGSRRQGQSRQIFVAGEAALAALLLVQSGFFIKSFALASAVDPGFAVDHLLTFYLSLPPSRYGYEHPASTAPLIHNVLERLEQVPGVISAASAADLPLTGTASSNGILIEGHARSANIWDVPNAVTTEISPGYFRALQVKPIGGTHFAEDDAREKKAIVNETFARRFFPGQSAIGRRIAISLPDPDWKQIIGVVPDVPPATLEQKTQPEVFFPISRLSAPWLGVIVRVNGDPLQYVTPFQAAIAKVDPAIAIFLPRSAKQMISTQLFWRDLQTWLVSGFATLAVSLAAIGIYAAIAYSISQRTSEIGVRMALGAAPGAISRMVLWQGLRPALIGTSIGSVCALGAAKVTASLLFGTDAHDANIYVASAVVLLLVSVAASAIPAWRAANVEPWKALRHE